MTREDMIKAGFKVIELPSVEKLAKGIKYGCLESSVLKNSTLSRGGFVGRQQYGISSKKGTSSGGDR